MISRERGSEHIICAECGHKMHVSRYREQALPEDAPPDQVHRLISSRGPFGAARCSACGHYTLVTQYRPKAE